jgi:Zn-dependent M28 family amino/carboxypeptidase
MQALALRVVLAAALIATPAYGQGLANAAVESISASDMAARIGIISDDSMMGRDTPSPGLERAAAYVIGEFRRLGLRPAGENGTYVQRFGVTRWTLDTAASRLRLRSGGADRTANFIRGARFAGGRVPNGPVRGRAVLLTGPLSAQAAANPWLRGRIVLVPVDYAVPIPPELGERVDQLAARAAAVILISNRDSATRARRIAASLEPRLTPDFRDDSAGAPVIELFDQTAAPVLTAAGLDLAGLRNAAHPAARELPRLTVELTLARRVLERGEPPNLIAALDGGDSRLAGEYVAISAHLDHLGVRPGAPDSIYNGADDNASGVAGLLELAEAFAGGGDGRADLGRSLLFVVPSGEEKGLWGSDYFTRHPTVPLTRIVADINMDLLGRNWPDSVIAVGPELSTLGATLAATVAAHPELRMTPLADRWPEERIFYRSDHYNFARRGVPVLFFTSGTHPDYHQPSDTGDRLDPEKAARLVRLLYHLTQAIADDSARPRWTSRPE